MSSCSVSFATSQQLSSLLVPPDSVWLQAVVSVAIGADNGPGSYLVRVRLTPGGLPAGIYYLTFPYTALGGTAKAVGLSAIANSSSNRNGPAALCLLYLALQRIFCMF